MTPSPKSSQSDSALNSDPSGNEWLEIGKIVGAHGLDGEVKVYPDSDFPERFEQAGRRWLRFPSRPTAVKEIQLTKGRLVSSKGLYVVKFANINHRDQAEALKGAILLVQGNDRPTLSPGEYYLRDLIGLLVIEQSTQTPIGSVISIANAGNDLLEIQLTQPSAQTVLIPFVPAIVTVVDIDNKTIEISPPKGLIPKN